MFDPSLRERCPFGPPYVICVFDEETAQALEMGSVTARAMVEVHRALEAVQPLPLPTDFPQ